MRIKLLPSLLINQIAAGEVIERPASIVKELLENSIDAQSSLIEIDIMNGGSQLIRIKDNGHGIHKDDLPLALARHATSKINSLADLEQVMSLGFRGEALSSIASIARLKLISCQADHSGWQIETEATFANPKISPAAHPRGTTVEVYDLFFNTPVRRKFLKSEKTEFLHIEELVKRIALSHFDLHIKLKHNHKDVLLLPSAKDDIGKEQRLKKLLNKEFLNHAISMDIENRTWRLWGWLALPEYHRPHNDEQYFYINARAVRDKIITHALRQIYSSILPSNRHTAFVLNLQINPEEIDVNVHPTKNEVRFREPRMIHDFIAFGVNQALKQHQSKIVSAPIKAGLIKDYMDEGSFTKKNYLSASENPASENHFAIREDITPYHDSFKTAEKKADPYGTIIAFLKQRYLLCETNSGLLIIDVPEVLFQFLKDEITFAFQHKKIISLPLLIPQQIALTPTEMSVLETHQDSFHLLGFTMELLSPDNILLRKAPEYLREVSLEILVKRLIAVLVSRKSDDDIDMIITAIAKIYAELKNNFAQETLQQLLYKLQENKSLFKNKKPFWEIDLRG